MNVLDINNVTKRFGNLVAVRDVSLSIAEGELCAIIGPNGAGKTTFFNLCSGFFPPTSGSITFDGRDITRLSTHERVKRGMARTFQITEIFPELTVFENVRIAAQPVRTTGTARRPQAPARPARPPLRQQPISGRLLPNAQQRPATLPGQREADARKQPDRSAQPTDEHFTNPRGTS